MNKMEFLRGLNEKMTDETANSTYDFHTKLYQ